MTGLSHLHGARAVGERVAVEQLQEWTRGTSLDSVLAVAVRYAEQTWLDHAAIKDELDQVSLRGVLRELRVGE